MELGTELTPESRGLVVVGRCGLEGRVGIANEAVVGAQGRETLEAYPLGSEDGAREDRIVHHLLLPGAVAYEVAISLRLLTCPFLLPYGFAVLVDGLNA